jgi:hypothetical protein
LAQAFIYPGQEDSDEFGVGFAVVFSFSKFLAFGSGVRGIVLASRVAPIGILCIRAAAPQHGRFLNSGMPGKKGKEKRENDARPWPARA